MASGLFVAGLVDCFVFGLPVVVVLFVVGCFDLLVYGVSLGFVWLGMFGLVYLYTC